MHRNIKLFFYYNFLTDFQPCYPIAILYFSQISGSYALGMTIYSITMLSATIFEIPTGVFSDKIGRRKTSILSSFFALLCIIFYSIAQSFSFLALSAVIEGLSRALASGNDDALLHDTLKQDNQQKDYQEFLGKTSSMFQASAAIAAILGSIVASWSFRWTFYLSIIPLLIKFIISFKFKEPKISPAQSTNIFAHTKQAFKLFIKNKKLRNLSIASNISFALGETSFQFVSVFIASLWPIWAIGFQQSLANIGATISYYFSGKLIKKFKEKKILFFGKIYSFIADMISLVFPSIFSPIIMSSTSLFFGISLVAQNGLMQRQFSQSKRATMSSLDSLFGSLLYSIFSPLLGLLADKTSPAKALIFVQVLALSSLYFYQKAFKKVKTQL